MILTEEESEDQSRVHRGGVSSERNGEVNSISGGRGKETM